MATATTIAASERSDIQQSSTATTHADVSVARAVLVAALALHEFFQTMLSTHGADPRNVARQMITKHGLGLAERSHLLKVAERTERARSIVSALEDRFGVEVHDESLMGRTIRDADGFTRYVFGRRGNIARRVFSHHIMLGIERKHWRNRQEQDCNGYVRRIVSERGNPLKADSAEKVKTERWIPLQPLVYNAKGEHLLSQVPQTPLQQLIRSIFEDPQVSQIGDEILLCKIMRNEIRHIIDHILDAEIRLPAKTIEVQSHLYECGGNPMLGFERDLKLVRGWESQIEKSNERMVQKDSRLQWARKVRTDLEQATAQFGELKRRHRDLVNNRVFSYVFSLVGIEHLPAVLAAIGDELTRWDPTT